MTRKNTSKLILMLLLTLGISGGFLFFPVQLPDGYTCYYHRIFDKDQPVQNHTENQDGASLHHGDHAFIDMYVHNYAWFWWGSLLLVAVMIYRLKFFKTTYINIDKKNSSGGR